MASREHETSAQPWGTLEELLLVSAVNRHGTKRWDSVAKEVKSRSSTTTTAVFTAQNCRDKFDDLKRRFVVSQQNDAESRSGDDDGLAFMVDELRRLRVEELRREVRRRDVSIVSLELKVKKMEEDRDRSLKAERPAPVKDLHRDGGGGGGEQSELPEKLAGKPNSGRDFVSDSSERENRSFNESNSTSQRSEAKANGVVEKKRDADAEPGPERNQPDPVQTETRSEPASANGKVIDDDDDDVDDKNDRQGGGGAEPTTTGRPGESNELSGSKRAVVKEVRKQNSDVQSSASLTRRRKRRRKGGDSSSGEEPEGGEEVSPATTKRVKLVKLEPLVKVLRIVRSHRLGSVFQRRLRSQESQRYKNLIREHVDLKVVQSRLEKGAYNDCTHKFFRDLLLVFSNAVVFFRKTAPEHVAALELRLLVLKEMNDQLPRPRPAVSTVKPKPNVESDITTTTTSMRPSKSSSIVVCGKRGSINALSENKKGIVRKVEVEEKEAKVKVNGKKVEDSAPVKVEDKGVRKKRSAQERRGERRSRTTTTSNSKNVEAKTKHESGGNDVSMRDGLEAVKKEDVKKKQGAASFLKRMKQNGSRGVGRGKNSSDVSEDESKDSMVDEEEEEEEEEKKKRTGRKKTEVERKVRVTRSSNGRRGGRGQESGGRGKRGVGRPPKKTETAAAGSGKRGRDNGEADQVGSAGRPRKRTRR
ncbi:putative transcription factor MYB-HB-like family [Rosa chinensis]|uniref:Putative transcription factor MYB-HB-like family n=1 Tax=Rosa chinensis TaxID=74649 RepID=A0A2P6QMS7_ROSCH|nr:uncharacterized protein LOC112166487 [Rosa chinensis]PRQ35477.1 putative transcription factor MYB-HB-like family [Rosa chinensis]